MNNTAHVSRPIPARPLEAVALYFFFSVQAILLIAALFVTVCSAFGWFGLTFSAEWPVYVAVFLIGYVLTMFGISAWNHRCATHGSFKTHRWIKWCLAGCGALAAQGYFRNWLGDHHEHHSHTDVPCTGKPLSEACDPHTPKDGFWHSFWGWLIKRGARDWHPHWSEVDARLAKAETRLAQIRKERGHQSEKYRRQAAKVRDLRDIEENREICSFFDRNLGFWATLSLVLPGVITGLVLQSLLAALWGVLFCGVARMAAVNVATALVNSYEHKPGFPGNYQHIKGVGADSCNNWWFTALCCPEGLHWGHHCFPGAANHGIYWWERIVDHTATFIALLEVTGLAWDVKWARVADLERIRAGLHAREQRLGSA